MKSQKITKIGSAGPPKRYDDACAAAHAMEILGERWALLVVRELHTGPKRFTDIRAALPGLSANVLTQRLEGLEAAGVVRRRELPPPAAVRVYELTEWGWETRPLFEALGRWAVRSPWKDGQNFSAASFMMSLRTMFDGGRAGALTGTLDFVIGDIRLTCRIGQGRLEIEPGENPDADVVLTAGSQALAGLIYGGVPLDQLEADGAMTVSGDRSLAESLPGCFPMPDTAPKPG